MVDKALRKTNNRVERSESFEGTATS